MCVFNLNLLLNLFTGATALYGSAYGKSNKTIHLSNVNCGGSEERIDDCTKTTIPLNDGKTIYASINVAGVQCIPYTGPVCFDNPTGTPFGSECNSGDAKFAEDVTNDQGTLLFCYKGQWSPFCSISDAAASVACTQLGYSLFTGQLFQFMHSSFICATQHYCYQFFPHMYRCFSVD